MRSQHRSLPLPSWSPSVSPSRFVAAAIALATLGFASFACQKTAEPVASAPAPAPATPPAPPPPEVKPPLRIAYSDWPGWTAFEIAIQKGWFKEAGVDVEVRLVRVHAIDGGVRRRQGRRGDGDDGRRAGHRGAAARVASAILVTDYSNGNDMIVAKPGHQDARRR